MRPRLSFCVGSVVKEWRAMPDLSIADVFDNNRESIMALPGVVGFGIGEQGGKPCLRVMVEVATPAVRVGIPDLLGGYPVVVDETGPISALDVH